MSTPALKSRKVSISAAVPEATGRNRNNGPLQSRPLTPYRRIPNSYMQIGQTPHNSFAPDCDRIAASPRQIGNHPLHQAGTSHIRASLVAQRLRSFRMRADQENGSIDEGADGKTTPPYQSKGNTPTSIRQITKRLGEETFEHGIFKG